jgi:cobalamin biosynthetic protein CobC
VRLDRILHAAGLKVVGGTDLFRLVETENATRLWEHLAHHGIYVRRFDWSDRLVRIGLPETDAAETRLSAGLTP